MKYVDEFRNRAVVAALAERVKQTITRPWTIMEVCGGQTHAIVRFGSMAYCRSALLSSMNQAVRIASLPMVIFYAFGDMLRVHGSHGDLFGVYSPLDAFELARKNSDREAVCFAVKSETTAPGGTHRVFDLLSSEQLPRMC